MTTISRCRRHTGGVPIATLTQEEPEPVATPAPLIALEGVEKVYRTGKLEYHALRGVDLAIDAGEMVAVVGPSGSGKSTVMNMITGIDRPTAGTVTVDGRTLNGLTEEKLAVWRGENVGIVFQFFQLLPTLTALENACCRSTSRAGSRSASGSGAQAQPRTGRARGQARPSADELSGGEQQRVAIARALASEPKLIIGDEPTGNLDTQTAAEMFELLQRLTDKGKTVLYVTHDLELGGARRACGHDPRRRRRRSVRRRDGLHPSQEVDDRPDQAKGASGLRRAHACDRRCQRRDLRGPAADGPGDAGRSAVKPARRSDVSDEAARALTPAQLAALGRLPNVAGGAGAERRPDPCLDRRASSEALVVGVPTRAPAGRPGHVSRRRRRPGRGAVLTDVQNSSGAVTTAAAEETGSGSSASGDRIHTFA